MESTLIENKSLYDRKSIITMLLISLGYLLVSWILIGFRPEQLFLLAIINLFYFLSSITRKFILGFSVFVVYWVVFDYMKAFPNYEYNTVHIESLYQLEKSLFGFSFQNKIITPNEYWLIKHSTALDITTGFFYLSWVPVPLAFAGYLFFKKKDQFLNFSITFLLVNLIGFGFYYVYPAAPPWYMQQYGTDLITSTPGNTAGLARFDQYFGVETFHSLYAKSSNVFAAMPSLHSSYPVIVLYYGLKNRFGLINLFFALLMLGIWFSAVYTSHHYVLDVLAGVFCAGIGIICYHLLIQKKTFVFRIYQNLYLAIK